MKHSTMLMGTLVSALALGGCGAEFADGDEDVGEVQLASSVHLKGGRNAKPSFTDEGLYLSSSGALAGLGNEDVVIKLTATGSAESVCINPGSGEHQPPGQNPAPVTLAGTQAIPKEEIKNGNLSFFVQTQEPLSPIPGAPGCPNPRWTQRITDVSFTSATIVVEQPENVTVLTVSCTFSQPTSNGPVPSNQVTCTTL